jgi:hypothetical protein
MSKVKLVYLSIKLQKLKIRIRNFESWIVEYLNSLKLVEKFSTRTEFSTFTCMAVLLKFFSCFFPSRQITSYCSRDSLIQPETLIFFWLLNFFRLFNRQTTLDLPFIRFYMFAEVNIIWNGDLYTQFITQKYSNYSNQLRYTCFV